MRFPRGVSNAITEQARPSLRFKHLVLPDRWGSSNPAAFFSFGVSGKVKCREKYLSYCHTYWYVIEPASTLGGAVIGIVENLADLHVAP